MKLFEVPRGSKIRVLGDILTAIGSPEIKEDDILTFYELDGMYSICYKDGGRVYLAGWTEVEVI